MRSINLFEGIHINLVARRGSRIVKGSICFSALLLTTTVRWSHCSLVCALSNLEFAALGGSVLCCRAKSWLVLRRSNLPPLSDQVIYCQGSRTTQSKGCETGEIKEVNFI